LKWAYLMLDGSDRWEVEWRVYGDTYLFVPCYIVLNSHVIMYSTCSLVNRCFSWLCRWAARGIQFWFWPASYYQL
jgi:hypothetical protein